MQTIDKFIIARWAYSVGKPIITDEEYDILHNVIKSSQSLPEYIGRTWSNDPCPTELLDKYNMSDLKIDKISFHSKGESIDSVISESVLTSIIDSFDENAEVVVTPKINGWSTVVNVLNGKIIDVKSRARNDNTAMSFEAFKPVLKKRIEHLLPNDFTGTLFGESYLKHADYKKLKESNVLKTQVAGVSSAIKFHPEAVSISFFNIDEHGVVFKSKRQRYERMQSMGIPVPQIIYTTCRMLKTVLTSIKRDDFDFLADGIVVDFPDNETTFAIRMYDFKSKLYQSILVGLEESYGKAEMGLKVLIEPIETISGSKQKRVDIDNLDRLIEYGLTEPGRIVVFEKVSDTIEKIHPITKEVNRV